MSKHTKGEWEVRNTKSGVLLGVFPEGRRIPICEIATLQRLPCESERADARLIAAAPEMLELLQLVCGSFSGGLVMTFSEQDVEEFARVIKKATVGEG